MGTTLLAVYPEQAKASPCFPCKKMLVEIKDYCPDSGAIHTVWATCTKNSPRFFLETCDEFVAEQHEEEFE
jgi:hypothetical protein